MPSDGDFRARHVLCFNELCCRISETFSSSNYSSVAFVKNFVKVDERKLIKREKPYDFNFVKGSAKKEKLAAPSSEESSDV